MPVNNSDIADIFNQTADLLEIKGENPFRIRAYRNAARTMQTLSKNVFEIVAENGDLTKYPGIGKDLAGKIADIVKTGNFYVLQKLKKEVPPELSQMMEISGLGAKRVLRIYRELDIFTLEQLKEALESNKISQMKGFGKKTEDNIRQALDRIGKEQTQKRKYSVVEEIASSIMEYMKLAPGIDDIAVAGSFRRCKETIADLDILVTCQQSDKIMEHFTSYKDVQKILSKGTTRATVLLRSNFQVDVRAVPHDSYGAALVYFTGSKEHNIAIRKIGIGKKLKVNEYGVFKGDKSVAGKTELEVYQKLGLPYIEPELRENKGEIEAALKGTLPNLVKLGDIKGDLHVHSLYTDGLNTIEEMAMAARQMGYEYIAITDHSQHLTVAKGLSPENLRKQMKEIDKINQKIKGLTILKGSEIDILEDGQLDFPSEILKELDLRVCSVHHKHNLSKQKQTERVLRAMENPYFDILAHPTGRLIDKRLPIDIDLERIIKEAKDRGIFLELNAHYDRLDLNDFYCRMAKDIGAKIIISTDSHQIPHLQYMRYGIGQARRGWLEPDDVANTRPLKEFQKLLRRK